MTARGLQEEIAGLRINSPPQPNFAEYTYLRCEVTFNLDDYGKHCIDKVDTDLKSTGSDIVLMISPMKSTISTWRSIVFGLQKGNSSKKVNLSTPRPKGRGLLEVHPEPRLLPHLERRGFARSNG